MKPFYISLRSSLLATIIEEFFKIIAGERNEDIFQTLLHRRATSFVCQNPANVKSYDETFSLLLKIIESQICGVKSLLPRTHTKTSD